MPKLALASGLAMFLAAAHAHAAPPPSPATPSPDLIRQLDDLEKRWADQYLKFDDPKEIARLDALVAELLPKLTDEGRFSDLTYGPRVEGRDGGKGWGTHLLRVADLFTAWRLPGTRAHHDHATVRRAAKALDVYCAQPYAADDKWGFGHPYADLLENNRIGRCLLFARTAPDVFPQADIQRWGDRIILSIFKPADDPAAQFTTHLPGWEGGANVMWATRGELARFLTHSDQALRLRAADGYFKHIWTSMSERSGKGPQGQVYRLTVDGMLGEHDVPAMGSYGEWYLNAVVEFREQIKGLPRWEMPEDLNRLWIDVLLDSIAHAYQGAVDPHLGNPLVWLNPRRGDNAKLKEWARAFQGRAYREDELAKLLAWSPGQTDFPFPHRSIKAWHTIDFISKHYPRHAVSLRAASQRTLAMETFGQTEATARHALESVLLPLGVSFVRADTSNYQSLERSAAFSALDYARLPGLTTRLVSGPELAAAWNRDKENFAVRYVSGNTPFSAGAVTPTTGVWGWWQSRRVSVDRYRTPPERKTTDLMVDGRRATFFLDNAVVHLGAAFDTRHPSQPTLTNLDQRLAVSQTPNSPQGPSPAVGGGGERRHDAAAPPPRGPQARSLPVYRTASSTQPLTTEKLTSHDILWVLYDRVGYLPPAGPTTIQDLDQPSQQLKPTDPATKRIFSLFTDHGRENADLAFEWAVIPGATAESLDALTATKPWTVLSNTAQIQALEVPATGWIAAVFHEPGTLQTSQGPLTVDRPTVLVLERNGTTLTAHAADPYEQSGPLTVRLGDKSAILDLPDAALRSAPVSAPLR